MKLKDVTDREERDILTGMIVDRGLLGRIASRSSLAKEGGLFRSKWSNLISSWCLRHFSKYGKAPRKAIQHYYSRWLDKVHDEEQAKMVATFLAGLSSDYAAMRREINTDYLADVASEHFNKIRLQRLRAKLEAAEEAGDTEQAFKIIHQSEKIDVGSSRCIDLTTDRDALRHAFEEGEETVLEYPGALGRFFKGQLQRDAFVAFLAPEKRGKSYWMMDAAWRGMLQRRKVAYFVLGDMSEAQVLKRFAKRATHLPSSTLKPVRVPVELHRPPTKGGVARVRHEQKRFKKAVSYSSARRAFRKAQKYDVRAKESFIKIQVYASDEITVEGINEQIRLWSLSGWTPDIVIIDYADNLDMSNYGDDLRHQQNAAWKRMRKLAHTWHCLVITATQANALSYNEETIHRSNISEDKRKLAHVTGMVGINQSSADVEGGQNEKELGVYRLNWVLLREEEYSERHCVYTASCLALANPAVLSCF